MIVGSNNVLENNVIMYDKSTIKKLREYCEKYTFKC